MSKLDDALIKTDTKPFDDKISEIEQILQYLGLEMERHELMLNNVKKAKVKAVKKTLEQL